MNLKMLSQKFWIKSFDFANVSVIRVAYKANNADVSQGAFAAEKENVRHTESWKRRETRSHKKSEDKNKKIRMFPNFGKTQMLVTCIV